MIDTAALANGFERDLPIVPLGHDTAGDIACPQRTRQCQIVMALLDAGMPVGAMLSAERYGIQLNPKTIRRWGRGQIAGGTRARATYAYLLLGPEV